jgi:hypothetical protein
LIVPIIVFRNHRRFDPFAPVSKSADPADSVRDFFIDVTTIRQELKKLLLPHQELLVVTGTHEIHEHHHIATALFKSIRSDTIHSVGSDGVYRAKVIPHVDSAVLEEEMKHAVDALTTGLLHSSGLSAHVPPAAAQPGPSNMAPAAPGTSSHGHRILPVYVFSLLGMEKSLLFDHRHVHTAYVSSPLSHPALYSASKICILVFRSVCLSLQISKCCHGITNRFCCDSTALFLAKWYRSYQCPYTDSTHRGRISDCTRRSDESL